MVANVTFTVEQYNKAIEESRKAGIKEVVDFIEQQRVSGFTLIQGIGEGIPISEAKYQAKLKEWGYDNQNKCCKEE